VAHLVAHLRALGRQFTTPRHLAKSSAIPGIRPSTKRERRGSKITSISRNRGRIGADARSVKVLRPARTVIPGRCVSIEPGISRFPDAQLRI
jgi:hypothetical protein